MRSLMALSLALCGTALTAPAQDVILFRAAGGDLATPATYGFGSAPSTGTAVTSVSDLGNPGVGSFSFSATPFGGIGGARASFAAAHRNGNAIGNMTQMSANGVSFGADFSSPVTRVADAGSGDLLFANFAGAGGFTDGARTQINFSLGSFGNSSNTSFKYNFVRGLDANDNEVFELLFVAGSGGQTRDVYVRGADDDSTTLSSTGDPSSPNTVSVEGTKVIDSSSAAFNGTSVASGRPTDLWNVSIVLEDGGASFNIGGNGTIVATSEAGDVFPINSAATTIAKLEFSSVWNSAVDGQNKGYWIDDIGAWEGDGASVAGCHCADLAEPFGEIDWVDVFEYLARVEAEDPRTDLTEPFGSIDFFDTIAYLELAGTPPIQPNILWLTFEDTSDYTLPAYGQTAISTPNLDERVFGRGLRFDRAWSTAPVCSPARSSIISGSYATTYGTDVHRQAINVPEGEYFFPRELRASGYYTTNNSKTDYNSVQSSQAWDANGNSASWTNPNRNGRPFFSVYNSNATHTGRVRSWHLDGRRDFAAQGIVPVLPPHVPDLPETNSDYAFHLEGVEDIDTWVGVHLDALEAAGVADETIVFVFSDHGGLLPRGKGFVFETGLRVPFGLYVPPKLRCLLPTDLQLPPGSSTDRLIGFVDLAATVLSIAGIEPPAGMQGEAQLGKHAQPAREYQFGFVANREAHYAPDRTVTDGRYKYIRRFIPYRHHGLRNFYQWGMPAWVAWDQYAYEGDPGLANELWMRPYTPGSAMTKAEMLFDITADPYELNDLSTDPAHAARLADFRTRLGQHMRDTEDLGFFPPNMRDIYNGTPIHTWVRDTSYDIDGLIAAAELASLATPADAPAFLANLNSDDRALKFWGAVGYANLASQGQITAAELPSALNSALNNGNWAIGAAAAEAFVLAGNPAPIDQQIDRVVGNGNQYAYSALATLTRFPNAASEIASRAQPLLDVAASSNRARAICINLGLWPAADLFPNSYNNGLSVNQDVRGIGPLP